MRRIAASGRTVDENAGGGLTLSGDITAEVNTDARFSPGQVDSGG